MKEKAKSMIKDNIQMLNDINNILELFKRDPKLTSFKKSFGVKDKFNTNDKHSKNDKKDDNYEKDNDSIKHFFVSFERSKRNLSCLNLRFDDIGSSFKDHNDFHYISFEEIEIKDILKKFIFVLINVYGFKDDSFKDNLKDLNANNTNNEKREKTYY